jgi:hypothetical protein
VTIEAELKRRLSDDTLVDWVLRDAAPGDDLPTEPVSDLVTRQRLADVLSALQSLSVTVTNPTETGLAKEATLAAVLAALGQEVTLDAATLAALETINVGNLPTDYPLPSEQVTSLKTVQVSNFPTSQPVSGTVAISNPTADPETGLAKDSTLQSVRDRADFPLPAAQVTSLKEVAVANFPGTQPVSGPLTDSQLRASAVSVTGTFETLLTRLANFLSPTEPVSVSGSAAAGAALSVSIPAVVGKTNHIQRFTLTSGSTAVNPVTADVTMTGPTSAHSYRFVQPTTVGGRLDPFWIPALPASGPNVAITVSIPAITGGAVLALNLTGFRI